jgi:predicted  nucleic acid-binding Zn-ribbon protein
LKIFKKQLSLKQYLTFFAAFIFISLITLIGGEKIYLEVKLYNQGTQISLLEQVNLDLKQQETSLNTLLNQQNSIINNLNRSKNSLDLEFSQVIEQTKSIEASLASLLEVSQELEKEIEDLNKKLVSNLIIDKRSQEVRTLNELNLDYDALIAQTRNQISFYQQGISTYTALNQQLTTNNNALLTLIASLNTQISDKQGLLDDLADDLAALNQEITTISLSIATKELEILSIDLEAISDSELQEIKETLTVLKKTYDDLLNDKKDVSDKIVVAEAEVTRLQNITVGLQTQYDGLLAANELLALSVELLEEQVADQVARLTQLDQQIVQVNNDILNLELFVTNNALNVSLNDINYVSQVSVKANAMIRLSTTITDNNYGSGIVIDTKPGSTSQVNKFFILTNYETVAGHISNSSIPIYVYNYFFNRYDGGSVVYHDGSKFALIAVEAPLNTFIAISLASANYEVSANELVFSISSQARYINALRVGRVESKLVENNLDIFTHNAFLIGQSLNGGAILNQDYQIIGLNFNTLTNKAYSIEEIDKFLTLAAGVN